jgi:hypothetical protein
VDAVHVGREGFAVRRPVEHPRCDHAGKAWTRDEGGGSPVPVRHAVPQSFAAWRSAIATSFIRRCPSLIDEDELLGIKIDLTLEPSLVPLQVVWAILLGRIRWLFNA